MSRNLHQYLHARLIARQPLSELWRKYHKARGRWSKVSWSQEWLDVAQRRADILYRFFSTGERVDDIVEK